MTSGGGTRNRCFPNGWNPAAKLCDFCKSATALLFCKPESAFMCMACDSRIHGMNDLKHERVWMCQVCEQEPASVTCKADAASLCVTCDSDIHSANPLARRHERVPAFSFYDTAEAVIMKSSAAPEDSVISDDSPAKLDDFMTQNGFLTDSWNLMAPIVSGKLTENVTREIKQIEFMFPETDQFLDFESCQISSQPYSDRVVPVQTTIKTLPLTETQSRETIFDVDFKRSTFYSYNAASHSRSISSSSMEVGVVPDTSTISEISYPFSGSMSTVDLTGNRITPLIGMTREARVLRYREKKKNRKFEKTIRYASRKAYAETRPRIKGRFAKRTDVDSDIERFFSSNSDFIPVAKYGVVPTFYAGICDNF